MDRGTKRSLAGLVIAAVALGAFTLSPVSAHFTQNTRHLGNHAWKQVVRKKADKRYVRRCRPGAALAWAYVASSELSTTDFSTAGVHPQYNCAGGPITVLKVIAAGHYQVRVPGIKDSPGGGERLVATVSPTDHLARMMSHDIHTGDDYIEVDAFAHDGTNADADFVIVVYRKP